MKNSSTSRAIRRDLREEFALDAEMARRALTHEQARAQERDEVRVEIKEARARHPKQKKSKYLVAKISLRWFFVGLLGLVLLMFLLLRPHRPLGEWSDPVLVAYAGALMACLAVQPWVKRTLKFWLSLAISCVPMFVVGHLLTGHHPAHSRAEVKGTGFLSILAGYTVGVAVFLLLQKLKPGQEAEEKVAR